MAEFVTVMKDWQRMCASMQGGIAKCDNCPLFKVLCQYKPNEKVDLAGAEKIIEKWAEDNPEPVYPTWIEWLHTTSAVDGTLDIPVGDGTIFRVAIKNEPIPADIAEQLGLKPKEVRH